MDAETWKETGVKTGHDGTGEFSEMGFGLSDCFVSDDGSVKSQPYHDLSMSLQSRLLKCCRKHGIAVAANGTDLLSSADASSTRGLGLTRNPKSVSQDAPPAEIFQFEEANSEAIIDTGASRAVL